MRDQGGVIWYKGGGGSGQLYKSARGSSLVLTIARGKKSRQREREIQLVDLVICTLPHWLTAPLTIDQKSVPYLERRVLHYIYFCIHICKEVNPVCPDHMKNCTGYHGIFKKSVSPNPPDVYYFPHS